MERTTIEHLNRLEFQALIERLVRIEERLAALQKAFDDHVAFTAHQTPTSPRHLVIPVAAFVAIAEVIAAGFKRFF